MPFFDWPTFLHSRRIEYVTQGANVSMGHIAIRCPFCGSADPSQHMSINLAGAGWRCWRNVAHRGRSPVALIAALVPCSQAQAAVIAGIDQVSLPEDFAASVRARLSVVEGAATTRTLSMPIEFHPLDDRYIARPYVNYLHQRGFTELATLHRFNIRYAAHGAFAGRIIFPVTIDGQLVTWTGRTIVPDRLPRYKALTIDAQLAKAQDLPTAVAKITDTLFAYDMLQNVRGRVLYLVEGPLDALKLWKLGERMGLYATCLFTTRMSPAQTQLLHSILPRFERAYVLLDQGAEAQAMRARSQLAALGVGVRFMPAGTKDPGELSNIRDLPK